MAEDLVKLDPSSTEFRRDVAVSHAKLGGFHEALGPEGKEAALRHYQTVVEIFSTMKAAGVLAPVDEPFIPMVQEKVEALRQ